MVLVFLVCWLPFFVTNMVNLVHIIPTNSKTIYFIIVILTYLNSCANPFLYCFLSDNFKQSFQKVLCAYKADGVDTMDRRRVTQNTSGNPTHENRRLQVSHHESLLCSYFPKSDKIILKVPRKNVGPIHNSPNVYSFHKRRCFFLMLSLISCVFSPATSSDGDN